MIRKVWLKRRRCCHFGGFDQNLFVMLAFFANNVIVKIRSSGTAFLYHTFYLYLDFFVFFTINKLFSVTLSTCCHDNYVSCFGLDLRI